MRTGGQTGIDEAAIIAAQCLEINCSVLSPKGWRYRYRQGEELEGRNGFVARFKEEYDADFEEYERIVGDVFSDVFSEDREDGSFDELAWTIDLKVMHINQREKNDLSRE